MTTTTRSVIDRLGDREAREATLAGSLQLTIAAARRAKSMPVWPSRKYERDPVAYASDVLGIRLWDKQAEIACAMVPENARVAVRSGHKCGKSTLAVVISYWYYDTFEDARVQLTAPTDRQVNGILWRDLRRAYQKALISPGGGPPHDLARSGLKAPDFREIVGFTARAAEDAAGVSGPRILYCVDESSGVHDRIYEAIHGNLGGGDGRILAISNPTRREGWFFDAFHDQSADWRTFHLSSEETPNARSGRLVIPGLATRQWVNERREAWGVDSPIYKVRVLGQFVDLGEDRVISLDLLGEAEARWDEVAIDLSELLHVGVDPALGGRDETAVAARRGQKVIALDTWSEGDPRRNAERVMQFVRTHAAMSERPVVKVDKGGEGWRVYAALQQAQGIELYGIDFGWRPRRPKMFLRLRDELWFVARDWLRDGGTLLSDRKLEAELTSPKYRTDLRERLVVEPKDEVKKRLGRSPDRADAVVLAIWPHGSTRDDPAQFEGTEGPLVYDDVGANDPAVVFDPYKAMEAFGQ